MSLLLQSYLKFKGQPLEERRLSNHWSDLLARAVRRCVRYSVSEWKGRSRKSGAFAEIDRSADGNVVQTWLKRGDVV